VTISCAVVALAVSGANASHLNFGAPCMLSTVGWRAAAPRMSKLIGDDASMSANPFRLKIAAATDTFAAQVRAGKMTEDEAKAKTDEVVAERNAASKKMAADERRRAVQSYLLQQSPHLWDDFATNLQNQWAIDKAAQCAAHPAYGAE